MLVSISSASRTFGRIFERASFRVHTLRAGCSRGQGCCQHAPCIIGQQQEWHYLRDWGHWRTGMPRGGVASHSEGVMNDYCVNT